VQAQELLCVVTADWKPSTFDGFKAQKAEKKVAKKIVVTLRLLSRARQLNLKSSNCNVDFLYPCSVLGVRSAVTGRSLDR
jgi:hypothetical protein